MINSQLLDYIKESLAKGAGQEQISEVLITAGWSKADVLEAFKPTLQKINPVASSAPISPKIAATPVTPITPITPITPKTTTTPVTPTNANFSKPAPAAEASPFVSKLTELKAGQKTTAIPDIKVKQSALSLNHKKLLSSYFNQKNKVLIVVLITGISILSTAVFAAISYYRSSQKNVPAAEVKNEVKVVTPAAEVETTTTEPLNNSSSIADNLDLNENSTSTSLEVSTSTIDQATSTTIVTAGTTPSDIDSDNDGLSDENELIYGTDNKNPDTDGDGYLDGAEVSSGYNPRGPGKLIK